MPWMQEYVTWRDRPLPEMAVKIQNSSYFRLKRRVACVCNTQTQRCGAMLPVR